jgi:hypothetical protein
VVRRGGRGDWRTARRRRCGVRNACARTCARTDACACRALAISVDIMMETKSRLLYVVGDTSSCPLFDVLHSNLQNDATCGGTKRWLLMFITYIRVSRVKCAHSPRLCACADAFFYFLSNYFNRNDIYVSSTNLFTTWIKRSDARAHACAHCAHAASG